MIENEGYVSSDASDRDPMIPYLGGGQDMSMNTGQFFGAVMEKFILTGPTCCLSQGLKEN